MESLAVKYRPKKFEDMIEQKVITRILENQIKTGEYNACMLFCGGAGTGKTTCARIFANEINQGLGYPIEVDGASNNGVENVRDIIDKSNFQAMESEYKVYILDECHMLSIGAWNALLKLIEEPPEKTFFIFCTTDPQKIPVTVLSRLQRFDFKRISKQGILDRLSYICKMEDFIFEEESLNYIAQLANGGMRDGITLLDKCSSYSHEISLDNVIKVLSVFEYDVLLDLLDTILHYDKGEAIKIVEGLYNDGQDIKTLIRQFLYLLIDINKFFIFGNFEYISTPETYKEDFERYQEFKDDISYLLGEVNRVVDSIRWEQNPKEILIVNLLTWCTK